MTFALLDVLSLNRVLNENLVFRDTNPYVPRNPVYTPSLSGLRSADIFYFHVPMYIDEQFYVAASSDAPG